MKVIFSVGSNPIGAMQDGVVEVDLVRDKSVLGYR